MSRLFIKKHRYSQLKGLRRNFILPNNILINIGFYLILNNLLLFSFSLRALRLMNLCEPRK
jgi:hypothetical protein